VDVAVVVVVAEGAGGGDVGGGDELGFAVDSELPLAIEAGEELPGERPETE
jgi:hypothetical protein